MSARTLNQRDLASAMGVTPQTIRAWERQGLPCTKRKHGSFYALDEVIRWRSETISESPGTETPRDRLFRVQAENLEQQMRIRARELIPAEDLEPAWLAIAKTLENEVMRIARRIQAELPDISTQDQRYQIARGICEDALRIAATFDPVAGTTARDGGALETSEEPESGPMGGSQAEALVE